MHTPQQANHIVLTCEGHCEWGNYKEPSSLSGWGLGHDLATLTHSMHTAHTLVRTKEDRDNFDFAFPLIAELALLASA